MRGISTYNGALLQVLPGDMIIALNSMRAWETQNIRGKYGEYINKGEQVLVLSTHTCGHHLRLTVLRDNRILFFSCASYALHKNWKMASQITGFPTSGST